MSDHTVPTRDELREHLVASRIAGDVATTRENNLANFAKCSRREELYTFGLDYGPEWTPAAILDLMARRVGVNPDQDHRSGQDTIDPDLTLDGLDRMAARIGQAARRRERVLVATGHPSGVYVIHAKVAAMLAGAGAQVLTPGEGTPAGTSRGMAAYLCYVEQVGMLAGAGHLFHTHSPDPVRLALAALAQAGEAPPDLVVADHGWAGGAGQDGIDAVGYADCNDPALFIGEQLGRVVATVPLDDNVAPALYAPLTAYLLDRARQGDG